MNSETDSVSGGSVAGGSTDQHVQGVEEIGEFQTDKSPTADTPSSGSSNAGINRVHANRAAGRDDPERTADLDSAQDRAAVDGDDRAGREGLTDQK